MKRRTLLEMNRVHLSVEALEDRLIPAVGMNPALNMSMVGMNPALNMSQVGMQPTVQTPTAGLNSVIKDYNGNVIKPFTGNTTPLNYNGQKVPDAKLNTTPLNYNGQKVPDAAVYNTPTTPPVQAPPPAKYNTIPLTNQGRPIVSLTQSIQQANNLISQAAANQQAQQAAKQSADKVLASLGIFATPPAPLTPPVNPNGANPFFTSQAGSQSLTDVGKSVMANAGQVGINTFGDMWAKGFIELEKMNEDGTFSGSGPTVSGANPTALLQGTSPVALGSYYGQVLAGTGEPPPRMYGALELGEDPTHIAKNAPKGGQGDKVADSAVGAKGDKVADSAVGAKGDKVADAATGALPPMAQGTYVRDSNGNVILLAGTGEPPPMTQREFMDAMARGENPDPRSLQLHIEPQELSDGTIVNTKPVIKGGGIFADNSFTGRMWQDPVTGQVKTEYILGGEGSIAWIRQTDGSIVGYRMEGDAVFPVGGGIRIVQKINPLVKVGLSGNPPPPNVAAIVREWLGKVLGGTGK